MGCTSGRCCYWNIVVVRPGSWWLEKCKWHTHLQGKQEGDSGSYKSHLCPWESYRTNLLEVTASHRMDKVIGNILYGFLQGDSGTVGKEWEGSKCCNCWTLGWPLTQSPLVSLNKNWGHTDWISRSEGKWPYCQTQSSLTNSTKSKQQPATSSFPQGSTLQPTLFVSLLTTWMMAQSALPASWWMVSNWREQDHIQIFLDGLEKWADRHLTVQQEQLWSLPPGLE